MSFTNKSKFEHGGYVDKSNVSFFGQEKPMISPMSLPKEVWEGALKNGLPDMIRKAQAKQANFIIRLANRIIKAIK